LTCPTVLEAIELSGCIAAFIDVNDDFTIDYQSFLANSNDLNALIVTHTFGYVADILKIKEAFGDKLIIEDCAHAFLSCRNDEQIVGLLGDFAIFSHGFAKFPSVIRGGYLVLNNKMYQNDFLRHYTQLSMVGIKTKLFNIASMFCLPILNRKFLYSLFTYELKQKRRSEFKYSKPVNTKNIYKGLGMNICLLNHVLKTIVAKQNEQQKNAQQIIQSLLIKREIKVEAYDRHRNYFMLPVLVDAPDAFLQEALSYGVELGRHFVQSKHIVKHYGYVEGSCPQYEYIVDRLVTIPVHYAYPKSSTKKILKMINDMGSISNNRSFNTYPFKH
jgi:dTDP-4-amino-4,6-dideoxygalactose transaminase